MKYAIGLIVSTKSKADLKATMETINSIVDIEVKVIGKIKRVRKEGKWAAELI